MIPRLIAACGMNCEICLGFQRLKNPCPGCRGDNAAKPGYCQKCIIANCAELNKTQSGFCYDCPKYPCKRLKQLDQRYRTKYGMSMIENLANIKTMGLVHFTNNETERWRCRNCGEQICIHRPICLKCKTPRK